MESIRHTRQVYNVIDFIGDLGGVLEILVMIFGIVLYPLSEFQFNLKAINLLFMARTSDKFIFEEPKIARNDLNL